MNVKLCFRVWLLIDDNVASLKTSASILNFSCFLPKMLYCLNKYEPTRRQLCLRRHLVHNLIQSYFLHVNKSFSYLVFCRNLVIKTVCLEDPELNHTNHYS